MWQDPNPPPCKTRLFTHSAVYIPEQIHLWATALLTNTSGKGEAKSILLLLKMAVGKYEIAHKPIKTHCFPGMKLSCLNPGLDTAAGPWSESHTACTPMWSDGRSQLLAPEHLSACGWRINTTLPKRQSPGKEPHRRRTWVHFLEDWKLIFLDSASISTILIGLLFNHPEVSSSFENSLVIGVHCYHEYYPPPGKLSR